MTYQEERLARLRRQRSRQAIDLAMQGCWQEAVAANKAILEDFPTDVDAYNRLGRAYIELGEYARAREAYSRATELDPYNAIAKKNLQRLNYLGEAAISSEGKYRKVAPHHFIEEIGKAGVVSLYRLAPKSIRARVVAGDEVTLKIDGPLIVGDGRGEYLGQVEPRHGPRLIKLMEGGNKYSAAVVSSTEEAMTIIIREVYQDPGQIGRLSFPSKGTEENKPYVDERVFKLESEYEETVVDEPGYTIIGGGEIEEVLPEEPADIGDDMVSDEE